jgi:NAD(P)-dependent dehydrogenase (short-subunit alcohol dehydrogenase family)/acyl carrier protein
VLASRRGGLDDDVERRVAELRRKGIMLTVRTLDVADASAVRSLVADRRRAGMRLGGVVHAAGVSHDVPLASLSAGDVATVLRPKLAGAAHLDAATRDEPVDLFLLTSSVSAFTGTSGQAAYAAANAALESFAHWRRRQGRPATALALGPVGGVGMAARDGSIERYVELLGFSPLPFERIGSVLDRALSWNRPVLGVWDIDWTAWALAEPQAAGSGRAVEIVRQERSSQGTAPGALGQRLATLADGERRQALADLVADTLVAVLGEGTSRPGPDESLANLGLDSLMLVELQTGLNQALGAELSLMGLLDSQTLGEVAARLDELLLPTGN